LARSGANGSSGAPFLRSLAKGAGQHCGASIALQRIDRPACVIQKLPQCPFRRGHSRDTTGRRGGKSEPKITFENKGLMNAIYDVLETKSDIDWF
jgi:hypothetical protein